ncbi:MAG TPA: DUF3419 family protein [Beijerinckiaceae bacterium]
MIPFVQSVRRSRAHLAAAVHRHRAASREGVRERLFTLLFSDLVYPQIWEDPVVDMNALSIGPSDHVVAIASGGCNVLSYLVAKPARVTAVDLNAAHVALLRLKLAVLRAGDHGAFRRFFVDADLPANVVLYDAHLRAGLDPATRAYWDARAWNGRRRIEAFGRGFYRSGLLGRFIGAAHLVARLHGCDPRRMLEASDAPAQRRAFETHVAPLFDRPLVRWLAGRPASLYGLGIPPAQYRALAADDPAGMIGVLRRRVERLACDFPLRDNYFARQAFGRRYEPAPEGARPPYLLRENFDRVREGAARLDIRQQSLTGRLAEMPARSADCYVLLDAQDWMDDDALNALWAQITRTARPGARVVFRTAADEALLPGRVAPSLLARWRRNDARSRALHERDRSAVYGAFHLYELDEAC